MKKFIIVLSLIGIVSMGYAKDTNIEWKLKNPFTFFKDSSDYDKMQKTYEEAGRDGYKFERGLQDNPWKNDENKRIRWSAYFANNWSEKTRWNQSTKLYDTGYTVEPNNYNISVRLKNNSAKDCRWSVNGKKNEDVEECNKLQVFEVPRGKTDYTISVYWDNDKKSDTMKIKGGIKDILIVGLGDSFASGEGNPDIPLNTNNMTENYDRIYTKNKYLPRKMKDNKVTWLDRRAHRSLYSYQFKTALQYSLEHPQEVVTFVSFSSSGAVTDNILKRPKSAVEHTTNVYPRIHNKLSNEDILLEKNDMSIDRRKYIRPQIELLKDTIGSRKADILLLSVGGNDIGFVKYLKNVFGIAGSKKPTIKSKNDMDEILFEKYHQLNYVLKKYVIASNPQRIVLTTYPQLLKDENNTVCKGDRRAMNIPFGIKEREQKILDTYNFVSEPLYKIQKQLAQEIGWSFVDAHRQKYNKHGFCAKNNTVPTAIEEQFVPPHKTKKEDPWLPFEPSSYEAYKKKERWVQLPVDSILMINHVRKSFGMKFDLAFSDETSGIFHPSADGLAVTADANLKVIKNILDK